MEMNCGSGSYLLCLPFTYVLHLYMPFTYILPFVLAQMIPVCISSNLWEILHRVWPTSLYMLLLLTFFFSFFFVLCEKYDPRYFLHENFFFFFFVFSERAERELEFIETKIYLCCHTWTWKTL